MPPLNHSKKSSFITFGIRRKDKRRKSVITTITGNKLCCEIIAEAGTLQLFRNHKPKQDEAYEMFSATPRRLCRRFMKCKDNSLVWKSNHSTAFNHKIIQHSERMFRDQMAANNRRSGWLANDREPKSI